MQGKLKNDVLIRASITDNNIPFQAQGNTQQLQEFDKIFIELSKDQHSVTLGDYNLNRPNSYFMNFQKKLQGINIKTASDVGNGQLKAQGSVAIARGEYNRMQFDGEEGNQGPYKLIGRNGENFIIVISGSERIYIDGQLLTRGFNNDYIIDYNLGEITFTANRLITKDIRIVVEFEYSIQNYLRSLAFANTTYTQDKLTLYANIYSEQDAKNQPLIQDLSTNKISFLRNVGDDINNALFTGIDTVEFDENRILYASKDTIINGITYNYFEYSQNEETAKYALSFSNIGNGNGNYIFSQSGINGRVYQWVAPDSLGNLQGNYEPVIQLITPQQRQLFTTGLAYELKNKGVFSAEIGVSNKDVNTFSEINDEDDVGFSANLNWKQLFKLDTLAKWQLENEARYEFVQNRFEFIENYRPIEFVRDWNISNTQRYDEHLFSASTKVNRSRFGYLKYQLNSFIQQNNYTGFRHIAENRINANGFTVLARADYLHATAELEKTTFFRPILNIKYQSEKTKNWAFGFNSFQEKRKVNPYRVNAFDTDSLNRNSLYFNVIDFFVESPQSLPNKFKASFLQRWDYKTQAGNFTLDNNANVLNLTGEITKNTNNQLRWNINYRNLQFFDERKDENTILGEINYLFEAWKGLIRSNTNYKLGSGQKQVIEYEFTPVNNNLGTHVWQDLNENGIKEIDEFRLIFENEFPDTTYIQITLPSSIYQKTNIAEFTQTLNIIPKRLWFNTNKKAVKFLNQFELQLQAELTRHFTTDSLQQQNASILYSPILLGETENLQDFIVSTRNSNRTSLYYNRGGRPFNAELFYNGNQFKDILINGSIERRLQEQGTRLRYIFNQAFSVNLDAKLGNNFYASAANTAAAYNIAFSEIEPKLKWQNGTKLGIELSYLYRNSLDESQVSGTQQEASARFRYNLAQKHSFDGRFSFIQMQYEGNLGTNFNLENQILQALQVGSNYVWNLNFTTRLSKYIELRLNYNGRKSQDQRLQNTGRVQVSALF